MRRNKIFLAISLLITSAALTEARAHNDRFYGYEDTLAEDFYSIWHRKRENRIRRRGGWHRLLWSSRNQGPSRPNIWPSAEPDNATTTVDTATTINPLANDTGTGLTLKSLYESTQAGGTTSTGDGGAITYTPPAGFTGTDEFWYVVSDAYGRTIAARVTIEVGGGNTNDETTEVPDTAMTDMPAEITEAFNADIPTDAANTPLTEIAFNDTVLPDTVTSTSTAGVKCDYAEDSYNESPSVAVNSTSTWSCDESVRSITANGIPDHAVGTFPSEANANAIAEQTVSQSFTLTPTKTETMSTPDVIGYVLNGVKIDAVTTGSCNFTGDECSLTDNSGTWSIEAIGQTSFDFGSDESNGYVQADGAYRYLGMPEGFLRNQGASDAVMTLIGWAADGFPIYGRHGHSDADDADSDLKVMTGSYQQIANADGTRPSTETYAAGTFTQDWQYFAGSGDLDECNGRTGVTPEFPNGIYHYFATDTYPYLPRCVKGQIEGSAEDTIVAEIENPVEDTVVPEAVNPVGDDVQGDDLAQITIPEEFAQ